MASRAEIKRRKKRAAEARLASQATHVADNTDKAPTAPAQGREATCRPTPERQARGSWVKTTGDKNGPSIDAHCDMIGRLYAEGKLSYSQEAAARLFQELRAGYVAELSVPGFKSCLAGGTGAFDSTDGNPEAIRAYRSMEARIGPRVRLLIRECDKPADARPVDMLMLRRMLDAVSG